MQTDTFMSFNYRYSDITNEQSTYAIVLVKHILGQGNFFYWSCVNMRYATKLKLEFFVLTP